MAKRRKKPETKTDKALHKLQDALKRLDDEQGMVGRRNARTAVTSALRSMRTAVDTEYPAIRKTPKRSGKLAPGHKANRLKKSGYVLVDAHVWQPLKKAGLPTRPNPHNKGHKGGMYVPKWAVKLHGIAAQAGLEDRTKIERKRLREIEASLARAKTRGNERAIAEAELTVYATERGAGLQPSYAKAAIRRLRKDRDFRDALRAAGIIGQSEVKGVIESQLSLAEVAEFVKRRHSA
jgi:hypothetical protein